MTRHTLGPSYIAGLCVSLLILAPAVCAQNPPANPNPAGTANRPTAPASHVIRGKIFLPSGGLPEQRIRVVLELATGGIAGETFSDSVGNFEFRSVPSNSYRIVVPGDNQSYEKTEETVEVYGNFSRTFMVQLYLKDKNSEFVTKPKNKILSVADLQEVPKAAKKSYEQGLKRAKEAKTEEAIALFREALKVFPDYLLALNKLGEQYVAANKPAEAQEAFERAVAINPKFPLAQINLGMLLVRLKRFPQAVEHLEAANRQDDSYPMAHLHLGIALMEKAPPDLDAAERALLRSRALGGRELAYAHIHLYNLNLRRRAYDKAVEALETYLKEAPQSPDAPAVRETLGRLKKAMAQNTIQRDEAPAAALPPTHPPAAPKNPESASSSTARPEKGPGVPASSKGAERAFPSVVTLLTADAKGEWVAQGSGFFIRRDVIVTNFHLVRGARQVSVKLFGSQERYRASIINADPVNDLALLQVFGTDGPPLPLSDGIKVVPGEEVYAIGRPQGAESTVAKGVVSSTRRLGNQDVIQLDASLSPGSSGGPVLNTQGQVIGVAFEGLKEGQPLRFVIPLYRLTSLVAATVDK